MKSEDLGTGESGNNYRYDPGDFLTVDDAVETEQTGNESDWTTTESKATATETTTTTTTTTTEEEKKP